MENDLVIISIGESESESSAYIPKDRMTIGKISDGTKYIVASKHEE